MSHKSNHTSEVLPELPEMEGYRIVIVNTAWNRKITEKLEVAAIKTLLKAKVLKNDISVVTVPGAFELVFAAKRVIKALDPHAVICLGCIIKGETPHDIYLSEAVSQGIMQLNIDKGVPVIFGVLTTNNMDQAMDRAGGEHGNKGAEAALAALHMAYFNEKI
ncbi:MAG: 6,7-dimethyl-8-ribityllumazine synthase [Saprospiraceae bacterium]|jgi:6,7-dimethyl-8-ribityllumazine synthase|nr:6,7-dimethyl-8-ribityllumazine synthase [Saprospiraceae bacterium]MBK7436558.1 6,7-dimethyl-8-ribityllumazine synthase [Saprospiraceae bacterium]MBK8280164.1 6,7-dimethyl-8-ribityllumazine synthase [Saprospiraceae bacterium]MBK8511338.1 6,7-dimethyl-8-ribityllumazine synthase [Saprospiraceae bacterium]MBK9679601.1 6,7-dimethyl-8-ribityllumazine synthase [Saprospiraceae bacterium]